MKILQHTSSVITHTTLTTVFDDVCKSYEKEKAKKGREREKKREGGDTNCIRNRVERGNNIGRNGLSNKC
jgi:hypothetical protein